MKGRIIMVKTIRLVPDEVQHFVSVTSKCDFDIDIYYNRYVVDAKSFLGVYGLDLGRPLQVSYEGCNAELEEMLNKLSVAC
ncbi:MAG: HPr family phosphocarrier protein [Roseburia sp.]|nr:HPr family phosphocarrier protein [Roseburia sp.]